MAIPSEFDEIRPYDGLEVRQAFKELLADRQFAKMMHGMMPWMPGFVRNGLLRLAFLGVKSPLDFQKRFMKPVVRYIIKKHTQETWFEDDELCVDDKEHTRDFSQRYTFVSNHRDIVLDSAFLDLMLVDKGYPTTVEIGIGDNLLIYPWIRRLVRMNKAFTVRRGLTPKEMLRSSQLMSRYIHYAVTQKRENIWIAQREGRAKDSDDRTQDSVLKMLAMGGSGSTLDSLRELNIVPLSISYEYDPCDYLKAKEFQLKRDNPNYKKTRQDDLENMKTGIFGYKGRVSYRAAAPINTWLDELEGCPRTELFGEISRRIDHDIHRKYVIFPGNYVAYDEMAGGGSVAAKYYKKEDKERFEKYLQQQLDKIDIPGKDEPFLRRCLLMMYANPLRNYLKTQY